MLRRQLHVHQTAAQGVEEGLVQHRRQLLLGTQEKDLLAAAVGHAQQIGPLLQADLGQKVGGLGAGNRFAEELGYPFPHAVCPKGRLRHGIGEDRPALLHQNGAFSGHLEYLQCRFKHLAPPVYAPRGGMGLLTVSF